MVENIEKFKYKDALSRRIVGVGFKEDDLSVCVRCGQDDILESINSTIYQWNKEGPALVNKARNIHSGGCETGDTYVNITETDDQVEVTLYEIKRRWIMEKEGK